MYSRSIPFVPVAGRPRMVEVQPGARAPFCYGMTAGRRFYSFEDQAGRPAAVIVAHSLAEADLRVVIESFVRQSAAFAERGADIVVLGNEDVVRAIGGTIPPASGIQLVDCTSGSMAEAVVFVTDRNLRVAMRVAPCADAASACLRCLDELPRESARDVFLPAPVLVLPNLLSSDVCRTLIERFESGASVDGGIASIGADGLPVCRVDHRKKNRRDCMISPDDALHEVLRTALLDRCAPEIAKAFQAKVTQTDRILIARYDAPRGWFLRHRDNRGENVAFREFAISVNLNTGAYEGGHLTFPEYNDHRYRPPTGGGIIFSASLLHEAAAVSSGRRYVLLTFFHGDAAEAGRLAYEARTAGAG
jgi:predicted 2-oxoglutarate/Fe(II)-dependent dioxygenase YbiX